MRVYRMKVADGNWNGLGGIPRSIETDASKEITAEVFYIWNTPMTSLTITLAEIASDESGMQECYMFRFISGSTPTVLTLPSSVKGIDTSDIEAGKVYEVNIDRDGYGIMKEVCDYDTGD